MIMSFIALHLRALWQSIFDPLPPLWREARRLRSEIDRAKQAKRKYSHLERELRRVTATIIAVETGMPHIGWWK